MNHYKIPLFIILNLYVFVPNVCGQKSKWNILFGLENTIVNKKLSEDNAFNRYTIHDKETLQPLVKINAGITVGYQIGLGYDIFKWLSVYQTHKMHFRNYHIIFPGLSSDSEILSGSDRPKNSLGIPKSYDKLTVLSNSNQTSLQISHRLNKENKWRLHYLISLNWENYEKNHYLEDTPQFYKKQYHINGPSAVNEKRFDTDVNITLNQHNRRDIGKIATYSLGIGTSRKSPESFYTLRFEAGIRKRIASPYNPNNHLEITVHHNRYSNTNSTPYLEVKETARLPIYVLGLYSNVSIIIHPFVKKDDPNWQKGKRKKKND